MRGSGILNIYNFYDKITQAFDFHQPAPTQARPGKSYRHM